MGTTEEPGTWPFPSAYSCDAMPDTSTDVVTKILPAGDGGITIEFGSVIDYPTSRRIFALFERLRASPPPGFVAGLPTFCSLTVQFDPLVTDGDAISAAVLALAAEAEDVRDEPAARWRIPVCYDPAFAPDLEEIAARARNTPRALADIHAAQLYRVYMLGGFPGFAFMGDLPEALQAPRLASPRLSVPAG
jgi:KipI family sensor histidine kinase inhibitor